MAAEEMEDTPQKRWIVTYTKHMKQKRKVYQDGVLELCNASNKSQVILYDDCEKLIDRRFLKSDEIIKSGGTLSFETHIVDIGDYDGSDMSSTKSNVKSVIQPASRNEELCIEWSALYTTHITQKAKKYHDGILRLQICSSHLNQITLLNEDRAILSSKYLKSVASLETGKICEFPNYLVEICEKKDSSAEKGKYITGKQDEVVGKNHHENYNYTHSSRKSLHSKASINQVDISKPEKCEKLLTSKRNFRIPLYRVRQEVSGSKTSNSTPIASSNLPLDGSKQVTNNCTSKINSFTNSSNETLRDAQQILSVLKKPSPERSHATIDPLMEPGFPSRSSDRCQPDLQLSSEKESVSSQRTFITSKDLAQGSDCEGILSRSICSVSFMSTGLVTPDTLSSDLSISTTSGKLSGTTEVLGDSLLPELGQSVEAGNEISREVIHEMSPIIPSQKSLGVLSRKLDLSTSNRSLSEEDLGTNEKISSMYGLHTEFSKDSSLDQPISMLSDSNESCKPVSFPKASSTVHAASDSVISEEFDTVESFPTFDLGF